MIYLIGSIPSSKASRVFTVRGGIVVVNRAIYTQVRRHVILIRILWDNFASAALEVIARQLCPILFAFFER